MKTNSLVAVCVPITAVVVNINEYGCRGYNHLYFWALLDSLTRFETKKMIILGVFMRFFEKTPIPGHFSKFSQQNILMYIGMCSHDVGQACRGSGGAAALTLTQDSPDRAWERGEWKSADERRCKESFYICKYSTLEPTGMNKKAGSMADLYEKVNGRIWRNNSIWSQTWR